MGILQVLDDNRVRILDQVPGAQVVMIGMRSGERKIIVVVDEVTDKVTKAIGQLEPSLGGFRLVAEPAHKV